MKMYKATKFKEIKEIEVSRFTEKSYWVVGGAFDGDRQSRRTSCNGVFETWEEAHEWLIDRYEKRCDAARRNINSAKKKFQLSMTGLRAIKGMKNPGGSNE